MNGLADHQENQHQVPIYYQTQIYHQIYLPDLDLFFTVKINSCPNTFIELCAMQ